MNQYRIRPMLLTDEHEVATAHERTFESFFLTSLGHRFLVALYEGILRNPTGIAFVAEKSGGVAGFVAGSTKSTALYTFLIKRSLWRFAWASLPAVIRKPGILLRLMRGLKKATQKAPIPDSATLMSLGVLPEAQGDGIGRRLVLAFLEEACRRGMKHVVLETDRENNEAANCFYQKMGFLPLSTYTTPEGRQMNQYIISLPVAEFPAQYSLRGWQISND